MKYSIVDSFEDKFDKYFKIKIEPDWWNIFSETKFVWVYCSFLKTTGCIMLTLRYTNNLKFLLSSSEQDVNIKELITNYNIKNYCEPNNAVTKYEYESRKSK